jgi:hypothetical protein
MSYTPPLNNVVNFNFVTPSPVYAPPTGSAVVLDFGATGAIVVTHRRRMILTG